MICLSSSTIRQCNFKATSIAHTRPFLYCITRIKFVRYTLEKSFLQGDSDADGPILISILCAWYVLRSCFDLAHYGNSHIRLLQHGSMKISLSNMHKMLKVKRNYNTNGPILIPARCDWYLLRSRIWMFCLFIREKAFLVHLCDKTLFLFINLISK